MKYIVLHDFFEKQHKDMLYIKGDTYPKGKFKINQERVEFLQDIHPVYGVSFLSRIDEDEKVSEEVTDLSK